MELYFCANFYLKLEDGCVNLQVIFLKNVDIKSESFSFLKNLPSHPKDSNTVSQSSKLNEKLLGQFIKN